MKIAKRIIALISVLALILCTFSAMVVFAAPEQEIDRVIGDVDGDGNVSMADALTILRMAMDILPVENQQIADVDGDGFITSMDALLALRFAMHIEQ